MSMWDDALKGYALGSQIGDKVSRVRATKKERDLQKRLDEDPRFAGGENEIERASEYDKGVADLTRAAMARGIDLQSEFQGRNQLARQAAMLRGRGKMLLGDEEAPQIAPDGGALPTAPVEGIAPGAAPIAPGGGGRGLAAAGAIAPPDESSMGVPPMAAPPPGASTPLPRSTPPGPGPAGRPDRLGAARRMAEHGYAYNNQALGDQSEQEMTNIRTAEGAMQVDPITGERFFNSAAAAEGQRDDFASRGNIAGAQAAQNSKTSGSQMLAAHFLGMTTQELLQDNPSKERIEATGNEGLKYNPAFGADRMVYDPEAKTLTFMRGDETVHEQKVGTDDEKQEAAFFVEKYTKDPGQATAEFLDTRRAQIAAEHEEMGKERAATHASMLKVIEGYPGDPRRAIKTTLSAVGKAAGGKDGGGFDVKKIDLDEGTGTFEIGDRIITLTKITDENKNLLPPGTKYTRNMIISQDQAGNSVSLEEAGIPEETSAEIYAVMKDGFNTNVGMSDADHDRALNRLQRMYESSGGRTRGGGGGRAGPGEAEATDGGEAPAEATTEGGGDTQKFPFEETDTYVRNIIGAAGRPEGTPEEVADKVFDALVHQESRGKQGAVSPKGARGVAQLMPETARMLEKRLGMKEGQTDTDPEANRTAGKAYLVEQLQKYNGDLELALAAYNAGPGAVDGWLKDKKVFASGQRPSAPSRPSLPSQPSQPSQASAGSLGMGRGLAAAAADKAEEPEPPSPLSRAEDPKTHTANAARIKTAETSYRKAQKSWERWNDRLQDKYGPDAEAYMTDAERGTTEELKADFNNASDEMVSATRRSKADISGFRKVAQGRQTRAEQQELTQEFRDEPVADASGGGQFYNPRDYRGPETSQGFFAKFGRALRAAQ